MRLQKIYFILNFQVPVHYSGQSRQETQSWQETGGRIWRPWRNSAYWLAPHGFLSLLFKIYLHSYLPQDGTTYSKLGTLHQSLVEKIPAMSRGHSNSQANMKAGDTLLIDFLQSQMTLAFIKQT